MAGARLIDMEQIQFIPFGILYPEGMKGLEVGYTSAAGPYGVWRNKNGEVIVNDLPNQTREFVSRAIALEVQKGNGSTHGGLWLDPTENRKYEDGEKDWLHWKSIGTTNTLKMAYGTKASQWSEQFDVSPFEHYFMGGILMNENGETDITGLYAVGETGGGFNGAGRMGSMSLFDGLSLGKIVGEKIGISSAEKKMLTEDDFNREIQQIITKYNREKIFKSIQLKKELSKIMWEK
jgi:succinate dehydrogenase/fumarate reductase flavoprotein subunit